MNIFTKIKNFFNSPEDTNTSDTQNDRALTVSPILKDFLENEVLNGLDINAVNFGMLLRKFLKNLLQEIKSFSMKESLFKSK